MEKKKLTLDKLTIAKLSKEEMKNLRGGYFTESLSVFTSCQQTNSGQTATPYPHVPACHC